MSGDWGAIGHKAQGQIPRVAPGDPERCRHGATLKKVYLKPLAPLVTGCSGHLVHLHSASHRPFSPIRADLRAKVQREQREALHSPPKKGKWPRRLRSAKIVREKLPAPRVETPSWHKC